ncbi:MAG: urate hydroxylase PuuD, partial [Sandaracinaceae bacterium]|nr:urate hydroxylase PuuD [Sandaracinaceae bacterium]
MTAWLALTVRGLPVIFGVAWIGTSFYFNWLNTQVRPSEVETNPHVAGDLW